ncbi:GAF domain-containing sensor histidine kinase [Peribacillus alkalitolerans]|uniref:GAF domain-containing sensor histidine kinase n=1 Tax=Peribacillus alkalitolerans TaxID=1550385 RepID=UPI0013D5629C|nr:GAF domain-containing sensor histidine kinase [Peribacillus alkalitolerans]
MKSQNHLSELVILKEIAETLNKGTDIKVVLNDVLSKLLEITGFATGWIFLLDEHENYELVASVNLPPALLNETYTPMIKGNCWCLDRYKDGRLDKAVNIIGCKRLEDAIENQWGETFGLTHHASVPLKSGDEKFGILNIASPSKEIFKNEELALLESIALQIGNTIKRINLTERHSALALVEERNRLAQDLHDSVNQLLFSINLMAKVGPSLQEEGQIKSTFSDIQNLAMEAQAEMRALIWQLRPKELEKGIVCALSGYGQMLGLNVQSKVKGTSLLPAHVEETLFRIAQEAFNNCNKHSGQNEVFLSIEMKKEQVYMNISDHGKGFEYQPDLELPSWGLKNMKQRVLSLNGSFHLQSVRGKGTTIETVIPF